jgi:hypothetical protein
MQDLIDADRFSPLTKRSTSGIDARSSSDRRRISADEPRTPMLRASHIATALSAATGRSDRPNGRLPVGVCAYWGFASSMKRSEDRSRLKPE